MRQITKEDMFQYRMNRILSKFAKDYELEKEFQEDARAAADKHAAQLVPYFLDDIDDYCGIQDAYDSED